MSGASDPQVKCTIEHFLDSEWRRAATIEARADETVGHFSPSILEYDYHYVLAYGNRPDAAIACGFPASFEIHHFDNWPPFLLDLLPQGAGRRRALEELGREGRADGPSNDWAVLMSAAGNPPGALRIAEAVPHPPANPHPGFDRNEVIERREDFIEYARAHGAPVAGSTGVQGDAPKFLLTEDGNGRWHADGVLADHHAQRHWLVKFPRGKAASDRQVLRNEAPYYEVARSLGLRVGDPLEYVDGTLFVPRFDRLVHDGGTVERFGMESLYSLVGITDFGVSTTHDRLVSALVEHVGDPHQELTEYVLRDLANVVMLNTDNHGRNTAVLKRWGRIALAPLYDFAPMFLDNAGIARVCRWEGDAESQGYPLWDRVVDRVAAFGADGVALRERLARMADPVQRLPETMENAGIDPEIIERIAPRAAKVSVQLAELSLPTQSTPSVSRDDDVEGPAP